MPKKLHHIPNFESKAATGIIHTMRESMQGALFGKYGNEGAQELPGGLSNSNDHSIVARVDHGKVDRHINLNFDLEDSLESIACEISVCGVES